MNNIRRAILCLATTPLLFVLVGGQPPDAAASARPGGENELIVLQSDSDLLADQNWPIVDQEANEFTDPSTGVHHVVTTVVREKPEDGSHPAEESEVCRQILGNTVSAGPEASGEALAAASCSFVNKTSREVTDIVSYSGTKVEHHLKSFADLYYGPKGNYYKLTQIHVWWKRTNTKWTVKSATWVFGCGFSCVKCDGGSYTGKKSGTIGTPIWKDSTTSAKYIMLGSFPPLWNGISCELGGAPQAGSISVGYYNGVKKGTMLPSVCWN